MDIFDNEFLNFWRSLNKYGVKYMMVGGVATNLHGYERTTNDVDLLLKDTLENRQKLRLAFKDYGMGDFEMMERLQFVPGWTDFHLNNGVRLDIMTDMKGLEEFSFEDCFQLASIANIENVLISFLYINHLIANKKTRKPAERPIGRYIPRKNKKVKGRRKWLRYLFNYSCFSAPEPYLCAKFR